MPYVWATAAGYRAMWTTHFRSRETHMADELDELTKEPEELAAPEEPEGEEAEAEEETEVDSEEEPEGETPSPEPEKEEQPWTLAAVLDERQKRQHYEARVAELEKQLEESSTKPPDVLEDQEGFMAHTDQKIDQKLWSMKADLSRDMMQTLKADYPEKEAKFLEMVKDDPTLQSKMLGHPNPARFAYETAEKAMKFEQIQDVDKWEAQKVKELEEKIRKEMEEAAQATQASEAKKSQADVPSLAAASSKGAETATPGDETLEEVFEGR